MNFLQLLALTSVLLFGSAYAGNDDDHGNGGCNHPRFIEHGCGGEGPPGADGIDGQDGTDGEDGTNGQDGADGQDGRDGRDGVDGVDGIDGVDGRAGIDGVVDTTWITETRNWQSKWYRYSAASEAIQIYLPQDQASRITFGMSRVRGTGGYGVGYAYKNEDGVAFTLGLGTSGGEQVGKASVGFEFGGSGNKNHRHQYSCNYVNGELTAESGDAQSCN